MAGEWLKFEKATPDKPEVFAIASALNLDPDAVVGKLIRVWSWFDTHTVDGNGRGVTPPLLDRISGVTGFVTAMAAVGWIEVAADGVRLPNFDRHTGETAKGRALTAKRVAKHKDKGNGKGNAPSVTPSLPREEKRREDQEQQQEASPPDASASADPIFGTGLAFMVRKGIPEAKARPFLGKLRKQAGDVQTAAILADCEAHDISDPIPWLSKAAMRARAGPSAAPPSKTLSAIQQLEGMKRGLADTRNHNGLPEIALPQLGSDPGD